MNLSDATETAIKNDQQNRMLVESLKRKNEDIQQRLEISEKIRVDLQRSLKETQQQDHLFHTQQMNCMRRQVEKIQNEKTLLENDLKHANSEIDTLKNKVVFAENSKIVQDSKILEISNQCFKKSFSSIEELLNFMLVQPKYYEEEHLQHSKIQSRLCKKLKNEKNKRKILENEIRTNQINFEKASTEYENKISDLNFTIKSLRNQVDSLAHEADKALLSLQQTIATTKKPRLFFYSEPAISIPGDPPCPSVIDELREKVNISNVYIKDLKVRNKKQEKIISGLKANLKTLNEENENLKDELKSAQMLRSESEKQMETLRKTYDTQKDDRVNLRKKIKKQQNIIESQVENIQTLHSTISELEGKLSEIKIRFTRIQTEDDDVEKSRDFDSYETPVNTYNFQNQHYEQQMSYADCYIPDIPSALEPQIKNIAFNGSLQAPSKIKILMKTVCSYYEEQIHSLTQDKNNAQQQLNKYVNCFSEFIPKFTASVLNKHVPVSVFLDDPTIQSKTLAVLRRKCENAIEFPCMKCEAKNLTEETSKLAKKAKKYKKELFDLRENNEFLVNSNQEKSQTILELQTKIKYLQKKYNDIQNCVDKQKKEFLQKLENSKNETETEYEKIIDHLKKKYIDQRNTINDLSAQLSLHHIS
ncbi:hypothetical protein TRFO_41013 [Tritrichomonas foetus]|uniref:Uncharacterized protein n=1 Tax=Tritrichomonas foetus TaxID=1144522 RepID=A0A1J4IZ49_9EUKA|nr:hypothetical protein TRFO_41013 [Tritrichomonas foetus]|eukprot:OHS92686.1 hypothetical protein TRFO_41013 [Tritrichomonas foetus]